MLNTLRCKILMLVSAVCVCGADFAAAQNYPTRPLRLIVATTAGTQADLLARTLGPEMSKHLGQPIVVENKPGAGSLIAYEFVARQALIDGYTIVMGNPPSLSILPLTNKNLSFDPLKDLTPVIGLVQGELVFGSGAQQPWKTFNEFVAHARANPGKLNYPSSSPTGRLLAEALVQKLGLNMVHISYSATGPAVTGVITGETHMGYLTVPDATRFGDKFRALAITGERRLPTFSDTPTFKELGHPEIWGLSYSLNVRTGIPKAAFDAIYAAASRALLQPEVRATLEKLQLNIVGQPPQVAAKSLADQGRLFAEIGKKAGIQPE